MNVELVSVPFVVKCLVHEGVGHTACASQTKRERGRQRVVDKRVVDMKFVIYTCH